MLDRKIAPQFKLSPDFEFLEAQKKKLSNGLEVFYIHGGELELLKIELVYSAGIKHSPQPQLAKAVSELISEGTQSQSSKDIAEFIEGHGAFYSNSCGLDSSTISLYVLKSNLKLVLNQILTLVEEAAFPDSEIENYKSIEMQKLAVNRQKVSYLAREGFKEQLFPKGHCYYSKSNLEDIEHLTRDEMLDFYEGHYRNKMPRIYLSGNIDARVWSDLESLLGSKKWEAPTFVLSNSQADSLTKTSYIHVEKADAVQTALVMGKPIINRKHEDYQKLMITNTLLGGYFGSRLMANIREDKGYTYGIGSGIMSFEEGAYLAIQTEVGQAVAENTIQEIKKELQRLQTEKVSLGELQLVKNYILGSMMRNFDGAFEAIDRFKSLNEFGLDYSFYHNLFTVIEHIQPNEVQDMANKYLNYDSMLVLSAGKK